MVTSMVSSRVFSSRSYCHPFVTSAVTIRITDGDIGPAVPEDLDALWRIRRLASVSRRLCSPASKRRLASWSAKR
jgi:hypothetical protein